MPNDPVADALLTQTRMQSRIAKKAAQIQQDVALFQPLQPFVKRSDGRTFIWGLATSIWNAVERPGVAPTTKPKASDGAESFHFSLTTVTRTSPFTRLITGEKEGAAAAHESYIERENAPELYEKAALRRLETLGVADKARLADDLEIAIGGQAYIERKGAAEEAESGTQGLSMYGNLPQNYAERLRFWEEVEKSEREPRHHVLSVDPAANPSLWAAISADPAAPPELAAAAALPVRNVQSKRLGPDAPVRTEPGLLKISEDRALAVHAYVAAHMPAGEKSVAKFEPGRGGHVQSRLIISLPHELSADDRLQLVRRLCDRLFRNLEITDDEGIAKMVDVPFWSVVHKPEATSDDRNYHAHIVYSERPASLIANPQTGELVWDFAYSETKRDTHRKTRTRFPFIQPKIRSFNERHWPRLARHIYADLANEMLQERGLAKRLDPRTYEAMGITHEPVRRLKPNEYAKEKKGQPTKAGQATVDAQWERITDNLDERFPIAGFRPPPWIENRFDSEIRRWKGYDHPAGHALTGAKERWRRASFSARFLQAEAAAAAVVIEKIRSRLDAPGKSWVPKYPVIGEFLASVTKQYVIAPRTKAREHETTKREMEKYLSDLSTAQGPVIGNPLSAMLHACVPSVHPHKIKMIDGLAAISQQIIGMIDAGEDVDISAMHREARAAAGLIPNADPPAPKPSQPAPAIAPSPTAAAPAPAPSKPPPTLPKLPPGAKTPFKSTAGRLLINTEVLRIRARRVSEAAREKLAFYEAHAKDIAAREAQIEASRKDKTSRVTTSTLIDDRPIAPAPPEPRPAIVRPASSTPVRATGTTPPPTLPSRLPKSPTSVKPLEPTVRDVAPAAPAPPPVQQTRPPAIKPAAVPPPPIMKAPSPAPAAPAQSPAPLAPAVERRPAAAPPAPASSLSMPTRVEQFASHSGLSTAHTARSPLPRSCDAPQKAAPALDPKKTPAPPSPPPEPEPDEKALEHRKKRRRAINARLARSHGIGR